MDLVKLAEEIATNAHAGQLRRDGVTPYINHPREVASRVGDDPVTQAVAWLHDTIEDTEETEISLRDQGVPDSVIEVVKLLSKPDGMEYSEYLEILAANPVAVEVKVADIIANLSDSPTEKQRAKYGDALQFLADACPGRRCIKLEGDQEDVA